MKQKKIKQLFQAIEGIAKRDPKEVYGVKSSLRFRYANGKQSEPLMMLATSGKYMLPETQTIKSIITSIEPVELRKEVINLNRAAGFTIASISDNNQLGTILSINTARGIIAFKVELNEGEEFTMSDEEFKALSGWIKETEKEA